MKYIVDNFRQFLTEAPKQSYIHDTGAISLYHYTRPNKETLVLEPTYKKSHYSRREYETASTPRIFFYLDPSQKERFFGSSALYTVDVPADRVYDMGTDPLDYIKKARHPVYGLRKGMEWDQLLEAIREDYDGIFYSTSNFDVVAWFRPVEVTRVPPEEQAQLEGNIER